MITHLLILNNYLIIFPNNRFNTQNHINIEFKLYFINQNTFLRLVYLLMKLKNLVLKETLLHFH